MLRHIYLSICSNVGDVKYWTSKIPHRLWWIFSIFVQCSNNTESSPHCFVLVNIRIPTGDTLPSVSIIEFKYILQDITMLETKRCITNQCFESDFIYKYLHRRFSLDGLQSQNVFKNALLRLIPPTFFLFCTTFFLLKFSCICK